VVATALAAPGESDRRGSGGARQLIKLAELESWWRVALREAFGAVGLWRRGGTV